MTSFSRSVASVSLPGGRSDSGVAKLHHVLQSSASRLMASHRSLRFALVPDLSSEARRAQT
eukprot:27512-Eustigmatos_ZCMA.PRE.1